MFLSMGNIAQSQQGGLLFISFERPHRLRVQGTASISHDDSLMAQYKEADLLVRVKLHELWQNCPRDVHRRKGKCRCSGAFSCSIKKNFVALGMARYAPVISF